MPSFTKLFGVIFIPIQIATSAVSGVQELDLVVALDVSGGMDDETPVTLVQRYWDYDNNYPPHHIVYMIPPPDGNPGSGAWGPLGQQYCYQAPPVNALAPQGLEFGRNPNSALCRQYFSEDPTGVWHTAPLRGVNNTAAPPGDYVVAYAGANAPPNTSEGGSVLSDALYQISTLTTQLDQTLGPAMPANMYTDYWSLKYNSSYAYNAYLSGSWWCLCDSPEWPFIPPGDTGALGIYDQLLGYNSIALDNGATLGQLQEAVNAGNAAAGGVGTFIPGTGLNGSPGDSYVAGSHMGWVWQSFYSGSLPPASLAVAPGGGAGPSGYYLRYNTWYGSGSGASNNNEVIVPTGPPGPSSGTPFYTPLALWGPGAGQTITDVVANLDGNSQFQSFVWNGFRFPTLGALVEAARGNLESSLNALKSGLDLGALGVTPQSGYQTAYQQAAALQLQPLLSVENTLPGFLQEAIQMGNSNIGFTAFNDAAGTSSTSTFSGANVSPIYPGAGTGSFPLPGIVLGASNASTIDTTLTTLRVGGNRNVAAAIQAALAQLASNGRTSVQKAIVLITDGPPTVDLNDDANSTPAQSYADARAQAVNASNAGVPIYCLSIYGDPATQSDETTIYNDTNNDPAAGGIAAISGHGAKCYQVSYSTPAATQTTLTQVFGNIVRQLGSIMAPGTTVALGGG